MAHFSRSIVILAIAMTVASTMAQNQSSDRTRTESIPAVVYIPTPMDVVAKMLELASVEKDEVVFDLGCGDGRIVVAAAKKYGCKSVGVDIDINRVRDAKANVDKNNLADLVKIEQGDLFDVDLAPATVITLYLSPRYNERLLPKLEKLKPGVRIVSHEFEIRGVIPDKVIEVTSTEGRRKHTLFLWTTPLRKP